MAYNAGERKDVRRAEKDARLAERQRQEVITGLMSGIAGRRWMLERLEECHIFATSFSRDAGTMAFMEGERRIGLLLLNDIMRSCPDQYILMMRERNERDTATERSRSEDSRRSDQGSSDTVTIADSDAEPAADTEPDPLTNFVRYA